MIAFTIRSIPKNLHYSWKVISSLKNMSMRLYILKALRKQLEIDLKLLNTEQKLDEDLE